MLVGCFVGFLLYIVEGIVVFGQVQYQVVDFVVVDCVDIWVYSSDVSDKNFFYWLWGIDCVDCFVLVQVWVEVKCYIDDSWQDVFCCGILFVDVKIIFEECCDLVVCFDIFSL